MLCLQTTNGPRGEFSRSSPQNRCNGDRLPLVEIGKAQKRCPDRIRGASSSDTEGIVYRGILDKAPHRETEQTLFSLPKLLRPSVAPHIRDDEKFRGYGAFQRPGEDQHGKNPVFLHPEVMLPRSVHLHARRQLAISVSIVQIGRKSALKPTFQSNFAGAFGEDSYRMST